RVPKVDVDIDGQFGRPPSLRKVAQGLKRLFQMGGGLAIARPRHGPEPRLTEIRDRVLPLLSLEGVIGQPFNVISQVVGMHRFDRLADPPVEELPPGRKELAVHHGADPVVREVEALANALEHAPPDQLLDSLRGHLLGQPTRALQKSEFELPADDRGYRGELTSALADPLQPARNEILDTLWQRQRRRLS